MSEVWFRLQRAGAGYRLESVYADMRKKSWNLDQPESPNNPATFDYEIMVPRFALLRVFRLSVDRCASAAFQEEWTRKR